MKTLLRHSFEETKFVIFDFETENVNLKYNKPWELYFQIKRGNTLLKEYLFYFDWSKLGLKLNISADAARITQFNPQKIIKYGKDPEEILEVFDEILYNDEYFLVGHNVIGFDCFIHNTCRNLLGEKTDYSWLNRLYDTNCLMKQAILNLSPPKDTSLLQWTYKLNSIVRKGLRTNVAAACRFLQIPYEENLRHQAAYDVNLSFQIFEKLVKRIEIY